MLVSSKSTPSRMRRPEALDARLDHVRATDQDRHGEALVDHRLHRAQHDLLLAFGIRPRACRSARARSYTGFISRPVR